MLFHQDISEICESIKGKDKDKDKGLGILFLINFVYSTLHLFMQINSFKKGLDDFQAIAVPEGQVI